MTSHFEGISEGGHLYVRPALISPLKDNLPFARPLAGGPMGFAAVELIVREKNKPLISKMVAVESLEDVGARLPSGHRKALALWLDRLSAARPAMPLRNGQSLTYDQPHIMGVINVTPDSFSDGGQFFEVKKALARGRELVREGAQSIDIGGESTRPGADEVLTQEERTRVLPVIEGLRDCGVPLSIDSRKSVIMKEASKSGATIINDVSALTFDADAVAWVAGEGLPVILMHAQGDPRSMQVKPSYEHVLLDVFDFLMARIEAAAAAGILRHSIIVDPGIGFGKTLDHNLSLLRGLSMLHGTGCPLLLGVSRKSFIGKISGEDNSQRRLPGSIASLIIGLSQGVQMFRVHDVAESRQAIDVYLNIVHP